MTGPSNVIRQDYQITPEIRHQKLGYAPKLLWFTGLSGSGKSTLANKVEIALFQKGFQTYILDGDNVRHGLNRDLDFTDVGRKENIRRIAEVSRLMMDAGVVVLTAFISPFASDRRQAASIVGRQNFIEIFVDCPLDVCEQRDVKGLYAKARAGLISNFTGISSPFEPPANPDIRVETHVHSIEHCTKQILTYALQQTAFNKI